MARRALNAKFDWYQGGALKGSFNQAPSGGYPRSKLKRIAGWHTLPETDESASETPAGRMGEFPYPQTSRGKTLTCELQVRTKTEASLNTTMHDMRHAYADRSTVGLLIVTPWDVALTDQWATFARVLAFDADEEQIYGPTRIPSPWLRDPVLSFRQLDGRWLYWNESGTPGTAMSWSGNPDITVTNSGNAPAEPLIEVAGVASGADVHIGRNLTGGGTTDLWFRDLPAGTLLVDFPNRTASVGGTDVTYAYDAASSNWWDEFAEGVPPGDHNIFRGGGAGTTVTVSFYSASW